MRRGERVATVPALWGQRAGASTLPGALWTGSELSRLPQACGFPMWPRREEQGSSGGSGWLPCERCSAPGGRQGARGRLRAGPGRC